MRRGFFVPPVVSRVRFCVGLCALVASVGTFGRAQRVPSVEDVRSILDRGAFEEAERAAVDVCARVREQHGAESLESAQAQDLLVEALLRNGHAGADSTLELANDILELKERLRGPDHLESALSLHNLGDVRLERGELATAASLHERGLSIRLKQLPATMPPSRTVSIAWRWRRFNASGGTTPGRRSRRAQAIREAPVRAIAAGAGAHAGAGRLAGPILWKLHRRGEAGGTRARDSPSTCAATPRPDSAARAARRPVVPQGRRDRRPNGVDGRPGVGVRTLGAEHPMISALQRRLALSARAFGNLAESTSIARTQPSDRGSIARRVQPRAAGRVERSRERGHVRRRVRGGAKNLSACAGDSGAMSWSGAFVDGRRRLQRSDARAQNGQLRRGGKTPHARGPHLVRRARPGFRLRRQRTRRARIGGLRRKQYDRARAYSERALAIRRRALGNDHPLVARTLASLAETNIEQGRLDRRTASARREPSPPTGVWAWSRNRRVWRMCSDCAPASKRGVAISPPRGTRWQTP